MQTAKQTINLNTRRRTGVTGYLDDMTTHALNFWYNLKAHPIMAFLATIGLVAVLSVFLPRSAPSAIITPATPPLIVATPTVAAQPVSSQKTAPVLAAAVIAYDAPNGNALDAIEPGRAYTVLARSGNLWMQIRLASGGDVWVRSSKIEGNVPDLATAVPTAEPAAPVREYIYVSNDTPAAPLAEQAAPIPTSQVVVDAVRAAPCDSQPAKPGWTCAVGANDGQVYWLENK